MRNRINLLAVAVTLGGAAALGPPRPLAATLIDPTQVLLSCCRATSTLGELIRCCSYSGCIINQYGCTKLG